MKFTRYPKRDAIRDYFPLPNEIFSLGLSTGEIAVYAYLMYCEDRKTFQCHPSYKTIGKAVGICNHAGYLQPYHRYYAKAGCSAY